MFALALESFHFPILAVRLPNTHLSGLNVKNLQPFSILVFHALY